jgi:hypothetical protein
MARPASVILLLAWAVLACACTTLQSYTSALMSDQLQADGATFIVVYEAQDEGSARDVKTVLAAALPILKRWGSFSTPITIHIHPSHEALEDAVRHHDYPWLRAWARFDSIDLQSPRTWQISTASLGPLAEMLTHELTHCLMYQRAATADDWMNKEIPLWFREGMASVTSHQAYRRPKDEDVWRYLKANPTKDPVLKADSLYQAEPDIVYGAAHQAFAFLDRRYGDQAVSTILRRMQSGSDFGPAFQGVIGLTEAAFSREYLRYVLWEGWRGAPSPRLAQPLVTQPLVAQPLFSLPASDRLPTHSQNTQR